MDQQTSTLPPLCGQETRSHTPEKPFYHAGQIAYSLADAEDAEPAPPSCSILISTAARIGPPISASRFGASGSC
jgi:hypothetical protein